MSNTICVIIERSFYNSSWTLRVISEMKNEARRHQLKVEIMACGMDELPKIQTFIANNGSNSLNPDIIPVIFVGSIIPWQKQVATIYFNDKRIRPILASNSIRVPGIPFSSITLNRDLVMTDLVSHLYNSGARKIALVGSTFNSATDIKRYTGYVTGMRQHRIFNKDFIYTYKSGYLEGMEKFTRDAHRFDAVMFANDTAAIVFISRAISIGIRIPQDLMVTGFGNYLIANRLRMRLTTVNLNIEEIGRQAIQLSLLLYRNPQILSMDIDIECPIVYGSSTMKLLPISPPSNLVPMPESNIYSIKDFQTIDCLDKLCAKSAELDMKIIKGLVHNISYRKLAESLFISDSGFNYRLNKIFEFFQVKNKEELLEHCKWYQAIGLLD